MLREIPASLGGLLMHEALYLSDDLGGIAPLEMGRLRVCAAWRRPDHRMHPRALRRTNAIAGLQQRLLGARSVAGSGPAAWDPGRPYLIEKAA